MTTQAPQPQTVPDFVPVAKTTDIRTGEGKMVRPGAGPFRGKAIAVFNENGKFYAVNFFCPHSGGPISEGTIKDGIITCPFHTWTFQAADGAPHGSAGHNLHAYEVKVEGDSVLIGPMKHYHAPHAH